MRIVVVAHVSLDGVMQAPGGPDEDTRDGFTRGGWALPATDDAVTAAWGERLSHSSGHLFGRRTYEQLLGHWNSVGGPYCDALNTAPKWVVSSTLTEPLRWPNSTLIRDVAEDVPALKARPGDDLHIMGGGELVGSLARHGLIDEYMLTIHPLVLGSGRRMFRDGTDQDLRLVGSSHSPSGVLIATYAVSG